MDQIQLPAVFEPVPLPPNRNFLSRISRRDWCWIGVVAILFSMSATAIGMALNHQSQPPSHESEKVTQAPTRLTTTTPLPSTTRAVDTTSTAKADFPLEENKILEDKDYLYIMANFLEQWQQAKRDPGRKVTLGQLMFSMMEKHPNGVIEQTRSTTQMPGLSTVSSSSAGPLKSSTGTPPPTPKTPPPAAGPAKAGPSPAKKG